MPVICINKRILLYIYVGILLLLMCELCHAISLVVLAQEKVVSYEGILYLKGVK